MIRTGAVILLVCLTALPALSQMGMRMLVPPRIYAAPGVEMSLYFDNVVLHPNAASLLFDVNCSLGRHQQERWFGAPTAEQVGEYPLTLRIVSPQMEVIDEATTTVEVVDPAAGAGRNVSVLCVGDSLTNASQITARLLEHLGLPDRESLLRHFGVDLRTVEGPSMTKAAGQWVLLYSGNRWDSADYAVGHAICDGPRGPCTKPADNVVLRTDAERAGPGGAEAFRTSDGRLKVAYAAWDVVHVGNPNPRRLHLATVSMTPLGLRVT